MNVSHIDTHHLVFDSSLRRFISERTSEPDENGCQIFQEGHDNWPTFVPVRTREGGEVYTNVLRVAFVLANPGCHVASDQHIVHTCEHKAKGDVCIAAEHLVRETIPTRATAAA